MIDLATGRLGRLDVVGQLTTSIHRGDMANFEEKHRCMLEFRRWLRLQNLSPSCQHTILWSCTTEGF